mgnify:CR=1 FL=1
MSETETEQRLDIWPWRARFFKTRSEAAKLVTTKGVRVDRSGLVRKVIKPGATVTPDDILSFRKAKEIVTVRVLGLPHRRGPAPEAQENYELVVD